MVPKNTKSGDSAFILEEESVAILEFLTAEEVKNLNVELAARLVDLIARRTRRERFANDDITYV